MDISPRRVIGTCSICRGPVEEGGTGPAMCRNCGALRQDEHGPLVPMVPPQPYYPFRWYAPIWSNPYQPTTTPYFTVTCSGN